MKKTWGRGLVNKQEISPTLRYLLILAGVSAIIYSMNRLLLIPMLPELGFLKKYLGDMLALPVYLPLSFYLAWRLKLAPRDIQLHLGHILGAVVIFSALFEGLVPLIDSSATSDPADILAYFAGGLLVYGVGSLTRLKSS